jgi:hypothetical protein
MLKKALKPAGPSRRRSLSTRRSGAGRSFSYFSISSIDYPFGLSIEISPIFIDALSRMEGARLESPALERHVDPPRWHFLMGIKSSKMVGMADHLSILAPGQIELADALCREFAWPVPTERGKQTDAGALMLVR